MALIEVEPKSTRELFCKLQSLLISDDVHGGFNRVEIEQLQGLISQIDVHRPLGSDGKHGNLHTPTCGCVDKIVRVWNE